MKNEKPTWNHEKPWKPTWNHEKPWNNGPSWHMEWESAHFLWLTRGHNWPFRCLDFKSSFDLCDILVAPILQVSQASRISPCPATSLLSSCRTGLEQDYVVVVVIGFSILPSPFETDFIFSIMVLLQIFVVDVANEVVVFLNMLQNRFCSFSGRSLKERSLSGSQDRMLLLSEELIVCVQSMQILVQILEVCQ